MRRRGFETFAAGGFAAHRDYMPERRQLAAQLMDVLGGRPVLATAKRDACPGAAVAEQMLELARPVWHVHRLHNGADSLIASQLTTNSGIFGR